MSRLHTLQRIVQKVSRSPNLDSALNEIVSGVKSALSVESSSVFLKPESSDELVLMASEGRSKNFPLDWRIPADHGLVGLVAERAEPVNECDVLSHHRYQSMPDPDDKTYRAFLGVPVIDHRRLYGVLVVQRSKNVVFEDDDVAFLVTLGAQLASAIFHAELTGGLEKSGNKSGEVNIKGIAASPGVAIGKVMVIFPEADLQSVPSKQTDDCASERKRFLSAVATVVAELTELSEKFNDKVPVETRILFDAYIMMCGSDMLVNNTCELIDKGEWAPGALKQTISNFAQSFEEMEDQYLSERVVDINDLGRRILARLMSDDPEVKVYKDNTVLVGKEITATQLAEVPIEKLAAVVSSTGSHSSHIAILARALGVPTVMGAENMPVSKLQDRTIIVDGYSGVLCITPGPEILKEYRLLIREEVEFGEELKEILKKPSVTKNGQLLPIYVNSGLSPDFPAEQYQYCEGIGLHRTELPFMLRDSFPSEDEQVSLYTDIISAFPDKPVTLRTLDIGGDKQLSYFPVKESNPFLGWRGVRIMLDHPDIFLTQLRAMLRASVGYGNLHILFPMISSVAELDDTLDLLAMARMELSKKGLSIPEVKTAVMIEVPSAVYIADKLVEKVDYLSIGTNDLVQYLLAVDRNNSKVASLYSEVHPAVLMALDIIVKKAHSIGKPVSVCGEMASNPVTVLLLLGAGVDSLSVTMASLPSVKWVIQSFSMLEAQELFAKAIELGEPTAVYQMLNKALVGAGLGGLVRAGKS